MFTSRPRGDPVESVLEPYLLAINRVSVACEDSLE